MVVSHLNSILIGLSYAHDWGLYFHKIQDIGIINRLADIERESNNVQWGVKYI